MRWHLLITASWYRHDWQKPPNQIAPVRLRFQASRDQHSDARCQLAVLSK